jgi:hypothetical protein
LWPDGAATRGSHLPPTAEESDDPEIDLTTDTRKAAMFER